MNHLPSEETIEVGSGTKDADIGQDDIKELVDFNPDDANHFPLILSINSAYPTRFPIGMELFPKHITLYQSLPDVESKRAISKDKEKAYPLAFNSITIHRNYLSPLKRLLHSLKTDMRTDLAHYLGPIYGDYTLRLQWGCLSVPRTEVVTDNYYILRIRNDTDTENKIMVMYENLKDFMWLIIQAEDFLCRRGIVHVASLFYNNDYKEWKKDITDGYEYFLTEEELAEAKAEEEGQVTGAVDTALIKQYSNLRDSSDVVPSETPERSVNALAIWDITAHKSTPSV